MAFPPPEPQVPVFYYPLTVTCDPDVAGTASGRGSYAPETVVTDAVAVINAYLSGDSSSINVSVADVNRDGVIDITDAVAIINLTFGSKRGSKNGSKLATLVEVMCYAQDIIYSCNSCWFVVKKLCGGLLCQSLCLIPSHWRPQILSISFRISTQLSIRRF